MTTYVDLDFTQEPPIVEQDTAERNVAHRDVAKAHPCTTETKTDRTRRVREAGTHRLH